MTLNKFWKLVFKTIAVTFVLLISVYCTFLFISSRFTKNLDSYVYDLPFEKDTEHKIVQGYGGLFSHYHTAALDFEMPEGTPICAAREGVIYSFRDKNEGGGPFPRYKAKANYIMIKHSDGSFGCYWHLKKNGVVVKKGSVTKGQLIGYSGNTGFTFKPHLHFSVKVLLNYDENSFIKTRFRTTNGIELLENRQTYKRPND